MGDDVSVLNAFKFYGYPEATFSLPPIPGYPIPVFFRLENQWHLDIRHYDRIVSMTHFLCVPHEHAYSDWIHQRDLPSFTIPGSSLLPYFVGSSVAFGIGLATRWFRRIYTVILDILLFLVVLGILPWVLFTGDMAMFHFLESVGWVTAFLLGANIFRSTPKEASSPEQKEPAEQNAPAIEQL